MTLPGPDKVRTLIVGIDDYLELGEAYLVKGATHAAIDVARWLVHDRGVEVTSVELWLAPSMGTDTRSLCAEAGLAAVTQHAFTWAGFWKRMRQPQETFASGAFLIVYFCGHGTIGGDDNAHHLVLPEASQTQFSCIKLANWQALFTSGDWARFAHQLWVLDTCRNQWGVGVDPLAAIWAVGAVSKVSRCTLSSCSEGEVAAVGFTTGPRYTKELLTMLQQDPCRPWPNFEQALATVATSLRETGTSRQSPTVLLENWTGMRQIDDPGRTGQQLLRLLDKIQWGLNSFRPYLMSAQSMSDIGFAPPDSLTDGLDRLARLAPVDDIDPLVDFAARVADAWNSPALRQWAEHALTARQRQVLADRRSADSALLRLSLWYRNDGEQHSMEGVLDVIYAGSGVRPWPRMPPKPVRPGEEISVMGEWIQAFYDHVGQHKYALEIELFLGCDMLSRATLDVADVPLREDFPMRLGRTFPVVLRCADRYKGGRKLQALRDTAPGILARHGRSPDQLRWAAHSDDRGRLIDAFIKDEPGAPVWLGLEHDPAGSGSAFLNAAVGSGLPAAIWLHEPRNMSRKDLHAKLQSLLSTALTDLPQALLKFRCTDEDETVGKVALMLDDPTRIPDLFTRLRQPGE